MDHRVRRQLESLLQGQQRPPMREVLAKLHRFCEREGLAAPSRSTVYNFLPLAPGSSHLLAQLPPEVRGCLYNLADDVRIPGRQVAFYCFCLGDWPALSFAAALPWLDLLQASRLPGWRPRSRGLLQAVLRVRGISTRG